MTALMESPGIMINADDRAMFDREESLPVVASFIYELYWSVRGKDGLSWSELKAYTDFWELKLSAMDLRLLQFIDARATIEIGAKQKKDLDTKGAKGKQKPKRGRR